MKIHRKLKPIFLIGLSVFLMGLVSIVTLGIINDIHSEYKITVGDEYFFKSTFPFSFSTSIEDISKIAEIDEINSITNKLLSSRKMIKLKTLNNGSADLQLKIFGLIPYKNVKVNVVPKIKIIPGGQSVGVRLNTEGVLVVGTAEIKDGNGKAYNLALNSGIKIGDTLTKINNIRVSNASHVGEIIRESKGEELTLTIKRAKKEFHIGVKPIRSGDDSQYRLGLWVRDKTAGVGTLSFLDPHSKKFGALGHAITDVDTGVLLSVRDGEVIRSRVVSIQQGKKGRPGEIRGVFYETNTPIGKIEKNTQLGIYGELFSDRSQINGENYMPIGYQHEIKEGPAFILTTLDNNKIEKFKVEITKINPQTRPEPKSMVIRVTDERLLSKTGGIIQGMSGSPIVQADKIVGAVTHVLINDPTKGYGIFIEWMVAESGALDNIR